MYMTLCAVLLLIKNLSFNCFVGSLTSSKESAYNFEDLKASLLWQKCHRLNFIGALTHGRHRAPTKTAAILFADEKVGSWTKSVGRILIIDPREWQSLLHFHGKEWPGERPVALVGRMDIKNKDLSLH